MTNGEAQLKIDTLTAGDQELRSMYSYFQALGWEDKDTLNKITLLHSLKNMMKTDVVQFIYKKKNGEFRNAFGTRAEDVLTQKKSVPQNSRKNTGTFAYFDIEKSEWRCFKPELIQEISLDYCL